MLCFKYFETTNEALGDNLETKRRAYAIYFWVTLLVCIGFSEYKYTFAIPNLIYSILIGMTLFKVKIIAERGQFELNRSMIALHFGFAIIELITCLYALIVQMLDCDHLQLLLAYYVGMFAYVFQLAFFAYLIMVFSDP